MSWLREGVIWKGDILIAHLEDMEMMDASDVHPRRIKAKEVFNSQKGHEFVFPFADGTPKLSRRDYEFRIPTPSREQLVRSEDLSGEIQCESEESQPAESTDDAEACDDFRSIQGDFIYRHHTEPRVQLYLPKEETFPFPWKYIDVTWSTRTDLDVMQEKKIDDHWNVDSCEPLLDSWRGFAKFIIEKRNFSMGRCGPGRVWQTFNRLPDQIMYGQKCRRKLEKPAAQNREKQEWAKEKPKLDNARKLRGIYFIDPDDNEYPKILKK